MLNDEDIEKILKSDDKANEDVMDRHDAVILVTYDFVKGEERPVVQFKGPTIVLNGLMEFLSDVYNCELIEEPTDGEKED